MKIGEAMAAIRKPSAVTNGHAQRSEQAFTHTHRDGAEILGPLGFEPRTKGL